MKLIKKSETSRHENSKDCIVYEYPLGNPDINLAVIDITARYPDKGYAMNEECTEVAYVISGEGSVTFKDGKIVSLTSGDAILLDKGEQYYWDGKLSVCVPCTPAWYPEQHKIIEE